MANNNIKIPYQQAQGSSTDPKVFNLFQTQLASALQPITSLASSTTTVLRNQSLSSGANTIQTSLGYPLTGWRIIRQRAQAQIWDSQDSNPNPNNTLILNSTGSVSVDIEVF